jgi:hypothetical protein
MDTAMHRAAEPEEDPAGWARPEEMVEPFIRLAVDPAVAPSGARLEAQSFAPAVEAKG